MQIARFEKDNTIAWGGKKSAVLYTYGCNMFCIYCRNSDLLQLEVMQKTSPLDSNDVFESIKEISKFIDAVVITGGEPTIHTDLPDFMAQVKSLGLLVRLETNGTNPDLLSEIISRNAVDFIAMDVKNLLTFKDYSKISSHIKVEDLVKILRSIKIVRNSNVEYRFRTTLLDEIHSYEIQKKLLEDFPDLEFQPYRADTLI